MSDTEVGLKERPVKGHICESKFTELMYFLGKDDITRSQLVRKLLHNYINDRRAKEKASKRNKRFDTAEIISFPDLKI